jgi:hypothetical protein
MPEGARAVLFQISQYAETSEVYLQVRFDLTTSTPADVDDASEAAMAAFVAKLEELHPDAAVQATRVYECSQSGDAWPEP